MVKIDEAALEKAELLAKLKLEGSERERAKAEMERLLLYVEKLNELDTEGVEPMAHGTKETCRFREDVVTSPDGRAETLANAPVQRDGQFVVPKTV